jgi:hypothetical protein
MKNLHIILIIICIILIFIYYINIKSNYSENFENISEDIGNYLSRYFYNYAISISEQKDFEYKINSESDIIKYLPTSIQFNEDLFIKFNEKNITNEKIRSSCDVCIWFCNREWIIDMWKILKPTIHKILNDALTKSNLNTNIVSPIIHYRCADTPFIKNNHYYFQKYSFFKKALSKIDIEDNTIIIMYYNKHHTTNKEQESCNVYADELKKYITSLGYSCVLQSKTNTEDFADLFYSPYVISTGSSFSFMAGFFGNGQFISCENCEENDKECFIDDRLFLKGYNLSHSSIDSYYNIDDVKEKLIRD